MKKLLYFFEVNGKTSAKNGDEIIEKNKNCENFGDSEGVVIDENFIDAGFIIYRVESSENIEKIALKFNCPPSVIISENNLTKEVEDGDLLVIDTRFTELYRVKASDDVSALTKLAGVSAGELLKINRVSYFYPWQLIALGEKNQTSPLT